MVGAVKPQKAYPRALRVLAALSTRRDAFLVIIGGPVGRDGALAWAAAVAQAQRLGVGGLVRLPGFITPATDCLAAFDVLLNTSRYEGLSIATLEALAAGVPVVASAVGGQGELGAPGLTLMDFDAPDGVWADAIERALASPPALPAWRGVPTQRLWTLFHVLQPFGLSAGVRGSTPLRYARHEPCRNAARVLFVTANLNAGGAQRSLVNLALALKDKLRLEIAVCGDSSSAYFGAVLEAGGVCVRRTAASRDCFDHAEAIVREAASGAFGTVAFWNVDAKVKLLVAKALGATHVRLIDVSPGAYAFEEMDATREFQTWIAYSQHDYYGRLERLVMKHRGEPPRGLAKRPVVIPNGVAAAPRATAASSVPRIVMSGRIAPSKFIIEAVAAMRLLWRTRGDAELHLFGTAETRHAAYASAVLEAIGDELGRRIFLHGAAFDAPQRAARYSIGLVLGEHQGSPNAVLEALAAGLAVVANDSGGTRELVIDRRTGLLLSTRDPEEIATALSRLVEQPKLAQRLARSGRWHVERRFSMKRMAAAYLKLLTCG
jgi:glycosyltransferase involved in cell wall biosynthesis